MDRVLVDKGVDWVGAVPNNWKFEKGKYLFRQRNDRGNKIELQLLSPTQKFGCIPQSLYEELTGANTVKLNDKTDLNLLKTIHEGDFCISLRSFQGGFEYSQYEGVVSPAYQVFYPIHDNIYRGYYKYMFKDGAFIDKMNSFTLSLRDGKNIAFDDFGNTFLPVPPVEEQQSIADYLDKKTAEIDIAIKEAQELIDKYKEYRQVKAKEIFDYYLSVKAYKKVKLGSLSSLVTKQTGFDYSNTISPSLTGELTEDTLPYIQTRHFKDNYWNYETEYYIPKRVARLFPQIILNKRCLLFSIVGASIGNVAIYPGETTAFLGGAICKVDLLNRDDYDYIKHYMMSPDGQEQILFNIKSSAQGTITVQNVRDFKIPMFAEKEVKDKISFMIEQLSSQIYILIKGKEDLITQLQEYKKSIIFEYVTGKKEVPNG